MARLPKLEHVKYVRSRGTTYAYFNTGEKIDGKPVYASLPSPSAPDFYDRYAACKASRTKREAPQFTVPKLIDAYFASGAFASLAPASRDLYRVQLTKAKAIFARFPAGDLQPGDLRHVLDGAGWGAASCNAFVAAIGTAYKWARELDKTEAEPTRGIGRRETGEHDPWPGDVLDAGLNAEDHRIRLAVTLLYCTGLRIGDACKLRWGDIRCGYVHVTPQKTERRRKSLEFPVAAQLAAVLDVTPKHGLTILAADDGRPADPRVLRKALQAFTAALGVETVPHGLRKNAVNALLEAGCTVAEVASITGQTFKIVEHYAAKVNRKRLSTAAIHRLDSARNK